MIQQSKRVEEVVESLVKYAGTGDGIKLTAQIVDGDIKSITFRFLTPNGEVSTAKMRARTHYRPDGGEYSNPDLRDTLGAMRLALDELTAELYTKYPPEDDVDAA